jgi:tetratricopeptide (TPR) repeat protein
MSIYEIAKHLAGEDAFLMHQMAIYEMNRSNCNLQTASELLNRAAVLAPSDMSIKHSIAEHRLKSFDVARTPLEREKLLREATEISKSLKASREINAYSYHTLAKIGLKRLKSINITEENTHEVQDIIKDIERNLTDGIQQFPGDPYILDSEAQLASILSDSERVFDCLQKAFDANQRNPFFAIRLARMYIRCEDGGKKLKAQVILKKALESNPGESRLHYAYSKILMETNEATGEQLEYHLKRSFIPGDKNYDAQLLYGRQLFINGNREDSKKIFKQLGAVPMGPETRDKLLYPLEQVFGGEVVKRESVYCFIARDGISDWIYCYKSNIDDKIWASIIQGSRVIYKIAFSFRGANAFDLKIG